ncbi:MAG TPA: secretin and TonB N-terminal domain-containing protein, partial [Pirellulales bacterium]|nr:secretin and TonB N-terminal domain-containing protein [Pirellulales bacterium]
QLQDAQNSGNASMINQLLQIPGLDKMLGSPEALNALKSLGAQAPAAGSAPAPGQAQGPALAPLPVQGPREELPSPARPPRHTITHVPNPEGDDRLTISMQDEDLREVLELLSEQGGLNILASDSVEGKVSAVLKDVSVEDALDAILKSTGYVMRREGKFIYVGTSKDFAELKTSLDRVGTRVYRPNYVTAKELQLLVTPLLTTGVGRVSVTTPAQVGISIDTNSAGGDSAAHGEGVLVQDYEGVLTQVDEVVREIDRRPLQVHIEAMIIAVTLNDSTQIGVNFQVLRNQQNVRFGSGAPRINPLDGSGIVDPTTGGLVGQYQFTTGGLQFAFLDQSLGMFMTMLETVGDINVLATPRLLCLNKQRAEILIGSQIPYTTSTVTQTFTTQTVQFLDIGTQLRLRPYISSDGSIRMEIHPEVSSEGPVFDNVPSKNLTQVTTNVMCYDGCTIVIGGLMQEDLNTTITQIPYIGSLPIIGPLFRQKTDNIVRREILVLLTPRIIYEPEYNKVSSKQQEEFERREMVSADSEALLSRTVSARRFIRKGEEARKNGNLHAARRYARLAVRFDPNNRAAIALRDELNGVTPKMQSALEMERQPQPGVSPGGTVAPLAPHALDGDGISPMLLDDLQGMPAMPQPLHPLRPGVPGHSQDIPQPHLFGDERI